MFETIQAKLVFAFASILLLQNIIIGYMTKDATNGSLNLLVSLLFGIPFVILFTYDTNCLVLGNCNVWSWIRTCLYIIFAILMVVMTVLVMVGIKNADFDVLMIQNALSGGQWKSSSTNTPPATSPVTPPATSPATPPATTPSPAPSTSSTPTTNENFNNMWF